MPSGLALNGNFTLSLNRNYIVSAFVVMKRFEYLLDLTPWNANKSMRLRFRMFQGEWKQTSILWASWRIGDTIGNPYPIRLKVTWLIPPPLGVDLMKTRSSHIVHTSRRFGDGCKTIPTLLLKQRDGDAQAFNQIKLIRRYPYHGT